MPISLKDVLNSGKHLQEVFVSFDLILISGCHPTCLITYIVTVQCSGCQLFKLSILQIFLFVFWPSLIWTRLPRMKLSFTHRSYVVGSHYEAVLLMLDFFAIPSCLCFSFVSPYLFHHLNPPPILHIRTENQRGSSTPGLWY